MKKTILPFFIFFILSAPSFAHDLKEQRARVAGFEKQLRDLEQKNGERRYDVQIEEVKKIIYDQKKVLSDLLKGSHK